MPKKLRSARPSLFTAALLSFLFTIPALGAKTYLTLTYGFASVPVEEADVSKTKGSAFGVSYGKRLNKNFALEATGQFLSFGTKTTQDLGVTTTSSQTKFFLGGAGRAFLGKYLSANAGLGVGQLKIDMTNTASAEPSGATRLLFVIYYGAGLQIPIGETFELTGDYTGIIGGMSVTEYNVGIRLKFE